ncbi:MAG: hypothetical protein DSZ05_07235 [Sulfurospirillum sp.]|nr:MAG: hypothetical protein DSZ05_07235 [Sulfurospirillum sp.]
MKIEKSLLALSIATIFMISGCGEDRSHPRGKQNLVPGKDPIPYITETARGKKMIARNFVYIPGGFDVDGDGVNEGGFWLAKYEARPTYGDINISNESNISALIKNNFKAFDGTGFGADINTSTYKEISAVDAGLQPVKVTFNNIDSPVNNISALEAVLSLKHSQITDGYAIGLPSEKEWMQLVKLAVNNPDNWTGGLGVGQLKNELIFANGLLGNDTNVPKDYTQTVSELADSLSEWTTGGYKTADTILGLKSYNAIDTSKIPNWWIPKLQENNTTLTSVGVYDGRNNITPIENQIINISGTNNGAYALTARGEPQALHEGIATARVQYGFAAKRDTIGFRASSAYIKASHYPYELQ